MFRPVWTEEIIEEARRNLLSSDRHAAFEENCRLVRDPIVDAGDRVQVTVDLDAAPRVVEVPAELAAAFRTAPDVAAYFESLAFTHRKEYARWVGGAKKQETRDARASKAIQMLRDKVPTPG